MATTPLIDTRDGAQLEAAHEVVVQYLADTHAIETALVTTLRAHISMTPRGSYRRLLERHLDETRGHALAIERRLSEIGRGTGILTGALGLVWHVVGQALALGKGPIDALRGASGEEKLLKNARDECSTEALEIAAYDALEAVARAVGDDKTAELAVRHRGDEERMLEGLRKEIPGLAAGTIRERVRGDVIFDPTTTGAADALRDAAGDGPDAADLPIAGYDGLSANEVIKRLPRLSPAELRRVEEYERRHRDRRTVLARIEALRGDRSPA